MRGRPSLFVFLAGSLLLLVACEKDSSPPLDTAALDSAIATAMRIHDAAVEGTAHGLYKLGSKRRFYKAVRNQRRKGIRIYATQADVDTAVRYVGVATAVFHSEIVDGGEEVYEGTVLDTITFPWMDDFVHVFTYTFKTDHTYTVFDTVAEFKEHVFVQKGKWRRTSDSCTFTPMLCMTLDVVNLEMVLDTLMAPYSAQVHGDTMRFREFGQFGPATFVRQ